MVATEKSHETRLRRMADRQGLRLVKSRLRDRNAIGYGHYMLVDPWNNAVVGPEGVGPTGQPNWTLDEIEAYLTRDASYEIHFDTQIGEEIAGMASPSDLAFPLAHVLAAADRQGVPRPQYRMRVIEEGRQHDPSEAEQRELVEALEPALREVGRSD